jgi:glutaconate CoA-transferase, subunit A
MADGKLLSLVEAANLVRDGQTVAFGGSLLHRSPAALTRELARQGRRGLTFVKPSAAYDLDLLCAAGCVETVYAGIVAMEGGFGLASNYRRSVERGEVKVVEHA